MRKRTEILSYIFCLAAGVLLTVFSNRVNVLDWVVTVFGILFLIPSLVSVVSLCIPPKDPTISRSWFLMIPSVAGLILGVLMISIPNLFVSMLTWFFAIILIVFGVYQIAAEISSERLYQTSKLLLIMPIIITVSGVIIICMGPQRIQETAALITGIALLVYSINGLVGFLHLQSRKRQMQLLNQSISEDVSDSKSDKT